MNSPNDRSPDQPHGPIDELLSVQTSDTPDQELRGALLLRTHRVLRRRKLLRPMVLAAAMLGFYLAGLASAALWTVEGNGAANRDSAPLAGQQEDSPETISPRTTEPPRLVDDTPHQTDRPPSPPRRTAAHLSRFESLRALGDRHLRERRDPEAATRCYRLALRYASPQERRAASTEGSWLLRALDQDLSLSQPPTEQDHETDHRSS